MTGSLVENHMTVETYLAGLGSTASPNNIIRTPNPVVRFFL
jgi:hypothetical protein